MSRTKLQWKLQQQLQQQLDQHPELADAAVDVQAEPSKAYTTVPRLTA